MSEVTIEHEGYVCRPYEPGKWWQHSWASLSEDEAAKRQTIVREGMFLIDGEPLPDSRARFERAKILGTYEGLPELSRASDRGPVRPYLPGLMNHNTIPMLGGPPKAGKSLVSADLAATLVTPGRLFLDYFGPVQVTEEERNRNVVLINGENPRDELREVLLSRGLYEDVSDDGVPFYADPATTDGGVLIVFDLEDDFGGADAFDLTDPETRERWEYLLLRESDGRFPPLTVIVDGVTAILNAETSRTGRWFAEFKRLLKAADIPNGLAIGHTAPGSGRMMFGVESIAGPDGLWVYDAKSPDLDPGARRTFKVTPRLHGPKVDKAPVVEGDDGRLRLRPVRTSGESPAAARNRADSAEDDDRALRMRHLLHEAASKGLWGVEVTGRGQDGLDSKRVLLAMVAAGAVIGRAMQSGRTRGIRYWLTEFAPPPA